MTSNLNEVENVTNGGEKAFAAKILEITGRDDIIIEAFTNTTESGIEEATERLKEAESVEVIGYGVDADCIYAMGPVCDLHAAYILKKPLVLKLYSEFEFVTLKSVGYPEEGLEHLSDGNGNMMIEDFTGRFGATGNRYKTKAFPKVFLAEGTPVYSLTRLQAEMYYASFGSDKTGTDIIRDFNELGVARGSH